MKPGRVRIARAFQCACRTDCGCLHGRSRTSAIAHAQSSGEFLGWELKHISAGLALIRVDSDALAARPWLTIE